MSAPTVRLAPWEDFVLRVIAVYKLVHAAFFIGVGLGLLRLRHHNVVDFLNAHLIIPYHLNPEKPFVDWMLGQAEKITPHTLSLLGYVSFIYAGLFAAEGIGLYLRARWAEWVVVVVTGSLLPLEVYELFHKVAVWKLVAVIGNLLIVGYLIHRIFLDYRLKREDGDGGTGQGDDRPGSPSDSSGSRQVPVERVDSSREVPTKTR
jgi:uncharacterized membrane protein (DUF2068 family)